MKLKKIVKSGIITSIFLSVPLISSSCINWKEILLGKKNNDRANKKGNEKPGIIIDDTAPITGIVFDPQNPSGKRNPQKDNDATKASNDSNTNNNDSNLQQPPKNTVDDQSSQDNNNVNSTPNNAGTNKPENPSDDETEIKNSDAEYDPNLKVKVEKISDQKTKYTLENWKIDYLVPITKEEIGLAPNISEEQSDKIVKNYNLYSRTIYEITDGKQTYLEYKDPYTNVIFRDYSYHTITENNTKKHVYLLGIDGLILLAQEFKRKVTYGPEVFDLEAINVNNFEVIPNFANGLYIPDTRNIFINGSSVSEKGFSTYQIIGGLMPTVFHEYLHHWSYSYAETAIPEKDGAIKINEIPSLDKEQRVEIYYDPQNASDGHQHGSRQYWNAKFAHNFYNLLNFDVDKKAYLNNEALKLFGINPATFSGFLFNKFSINELWKIANDIQLPNNVQGSESNLAVSPSRSFTFDIKRIKYNYSLTELVPREYSKYAFESYFSMNDVNPGLKAFENNTSSIGFFGIFYPKKDENNTDSRIFTPLSYSEDWSRVFLNNFDSLQRQGMFQDGFPGDNAPEGRRTRINATMYPNSVFNIDPFVYKNGVVRKRVRTFTGIREYEEVQEGKLPKEKTRNRSQDFYNLFLDTMNYGSSISQIYYKNTWKWAGKKDYVINDPKTSDEIKFSGYLKDKSLTGIVVRDANNKVLSHTKFRYLDSFNFFGHKEFDQGAKMFDSVDNFESSQISKERNQQIQNRLYPEKHYYGYITQDFVKISENNKVSFWMDKNNDNEVSDDEIINSEEYVLNPQRKVTSNRSTTGIRFNKFYLEKDNNEFIFRKVK
ncbi:MYPU_1760 family metalloprotease [Mycoplasma leonicaptivi]|uniref:MYPU_1760 family metalloprotease n=1 Tax=Mycoplasma leonicaptivi TaxID=36742 RepID=UPI000685C198|nr:hypothetical protein [Mycoplasma leonicaptivi]